MRRTDERQEQEKNFQADLQRKQYRIKGPKKMADVLGNLMARQGYARVMAVSALDSAWQAAAGQRLAPHSRPGTVKRGVLEVLVRSSAVLQELTFGKTKIVKQLLELCPTEKIRDVKFRVAAID